MAIRNYLQAAYRTFLPWLYSRTNYKLFLQHTFGELDRRIAAQICATDVLASMIRPIPIKAPFGNCMLVIAPHQDDEVIGCGGAMLLQRVAGKSVSVIFVQDGGSEHAEDGLARERLVELREKEAAAVAQQLSIAPPVFMRHEILDRDTLPLVAAQLRKHLQAIKPDTIFVPFILDPNHDHLMTTLALAEALEGGTLAPTLYGYEVWALSVGNVVLNIDAVIDNKRRLLSLYQSQTSGTDYVHVTTGLNMYHSRTFGAGECRYAERFFEMPSTEYVDLARKLRNKAFSE